MKKRTSPTANVYLMKENRCMLNRIKKDLINYYNYFQPIRRISRRTGFSKNQHFKRQPRNIPNKKNLGKMELTVKIERKSGGEGKKSKNRVRHKNKR